jgi:hypothetical protein
MSVDCQECKALVQDWAAGADGSGRRWVGPAWADARAAQLQERIEEVRGRVDIDFGEEGAVARFMDLTYGLGCRVLTSTLSYQA